jgi:hypothetical protein
MGAFPSRSAVLAMGQAGVASDGIGCGGLPLVQLMHLETSSLSALKLAQRVGGDVFETAGTTSDR